MAGWRVGMGQNPRDLTDAPASSPGQEDCPADRATLCDRETERRGSQRVKLGLTHDHVLRAGAARALCAEVQRVDDFPGSARAGREGVEGGNGAAAHQRTPEQPTPR